MEQSNKETLYKSNGVLWGIDVYRRGNEGIADTPFCPNQSCHTTLEIHNEEYFCISCNKKYPCPKGHNATRQEVQRKWEGHQTLSYEIYSLDLPPTKVMDEDNEDSNYWVQARISEKEGKRMAVIYFGEKIHGKQNKKDYSQIFIDFDDEQVRSDKSNKNPMKLLCKLTAEFQDSDLELKKKNKKK